MAKGKGKRSDPAYDQVGAYVPKALYIDVKEKLVREDIDFSDLVTELLFKWTKNKNDSINHDNEFHGAGSARN